jgi:hypothetical protein
MRNRLVYFATIAILLAATSREAVSQQGAAAPKPAPVQQPVPKDYFKLNFSLRETDEGRVVNQRTFVMDISAEPLQSHPAEWWNMRSGTRIPLPGSTPKDTSYIDVGVNLDVRAEEVTEGLQMQITSEISSVGAESGGGAPAPVIRQVKVRSAVLAPVGRPTVVFTADDPASKHRFELEVMPTRAK